MNDRVLKLENPSSLLPSLPPGAAVLVIRLRSIGDVVLTLPAIAALNAWRPDLRISILLEPFCAPLVEGNPGIREVLLRRGLWPTATELRRRHFSMAFNMHGGPTSAFLTRLSGAPVRVCWAKRQLSFFYNVQVPLDFPVNGRTEMHTAEHRVQQFLWTGMPEGTIPPATVYPQADAVESVQRQLAAKRIAPGDRYAVLRPGGSGAGKRWPVEHFAAIAAWLRKTHGLTPVVNLGPGDEEIAAQVEKHLSPVSVVVDSLDLRQLIALLDGASLFVGNDTGPTHIAAALRRKCVVIFGSSASAVWSPWKTDYRLVQNKFPCQGCPQGHCESFSESRCILSVTVEQVREACEALLAGRGNDAPSQPAIPLKSAE
jgi:ADP-heptose:LPS heptosyltransferase